MRLTQRFTIAGIIGVVFWFLGPVITIYFWIDLTDQIAKVSVSNPYAIGLIDAALNQTMMKIGSFLWMLSVPLMIWGREFRNDLGVFVEENSIRSGMDPDF
ncbi:hypothetical protein IB024_01290 [Brucella sp. 6810]|uniref:hypothetical protein n=1 Tax=Brucella sp. 6810 TaxID=2769351 RepID=UPI00165CAA37|nr:hypothetical protein [Brucella sp. 6810]QNQ62423.1 hypothetical protein IB024_01290 [Brucella sp. 6810]